MTIESIRFRIEGDLCVLQVLEVRDGSSAYYSDRTGSWRDAQATDLLQVAAYTRAHDSIDRIVSSLQETVLHLQGQIGTAIDQTSRVLERVK